MLYPEFKITPVVFGRSVLPESWVFQNGSEETKLPILFMVYLIKTQNRMILVDAGCETMPGFVMEDFIGPVKALHKIGVHPEDITDVIITHSHSDHIECVKYFTSAEVYIQKDEYENGKSYFASEQTVHTFDGEMSVCDGVKVIKVGGHSVGSSVIEIVTKEKPTIITGDEFYSRQCITKGIIPGAPYSPENSRKFLNICQSGKYKILLAHDE